MWDKAVFISDEIIASEFMCKETSSVKVSNLCEWWKFMLQIIFLIHRISITTQDGTSLWIPSSNLKLLH